MSVRVRVISQARAGARKTREGLGQATRDARYAAGLRLVDVGAAVGRSAAWVSRVERGLVPGVTFDEMVVLAASVGLRLWATTYPGERAIKDAPQLDLLRRFRERIGSAWRWSYEVVVPVAGDRRAADAVIRNGSITVMIEAFTRLADAQAQFRAILLKARDLGIERLVLVIADTRANWAALAAAQDVVAANFPLTTRTVAAALSAGRDPGANGIVVM
jgi:transcriptional regulator with XRE-family HTH domain